MTNYVFSPSRAAFYATVMKPDYEKAGSWPDDPVEISDDVWRKFAGVAGPEGKRLGSDASGQPAWVD